MDPLIAKIHHYSIHNHNKYNDFIEILIEYLTDNRPWELDRLSLIR